MAVFKSFQSFRPAKEFQSEIPAPPYDVMSSNEAREMVKGKENSFLHIDRAEVDFPKGYDQYSPEVYRKARENLLALESSGKMIQDETPCLYIYRQIMNGRSQTGLVGCASVDDYLNNVIKKHEHTLAKKEQDRINHVNITDANTGPIFLTYRENKIISETVKHFVETNEAVYDFEFDRVRHTVWVIDDAETISLLEKEFGKVASLYIADGHHRCASAVKVGEMRRREHPDYNGNEEFNFFLAIAYPDSELEIMDYNRVVKDLNGKDFETFLREIKEKFTIREIGERRSPEKKHEFTMFYGGKWYSLTAKENTFDSGDAVSRLDVSILQNNLLSPVLGIQDPKNDDRIDFIGGIRGIQELERRAGSDMCLAFAMYPTTVDDLMAIADAGAIMPPKSTWFEPKPLSGIFIHHLS